MGLMELRLRSAQRRLRGEEETDSWRSGTSGQARIPFLSMSVGARPCSSTLSTPPESSSQHEDLLNRQGTVTPMERGSGASPALRFSGCPAVGPELPALLGLGL